MKVVKLEQIIIEEKTLQESKEKTVSLETSESENLKNIIVSALEDAKGNEISVINVIHLTQMTDYMVIASGTSNRHIQTLAEAAIKKAQENNFEKIGLEGLGQSEWVVVDFSDVVLHVMSPAAREHYNIEGLWDIKTKSER